MRRTKSSICPNKQKESIESQPEDLKSPSLRPTQSSPANNQASWLLFFYSSTGLGDFLAESGTGYPSGKRGKSLQTKQYVTPS